MSKPLTLILLLAGFILLLSGNIARIEYFFDTDPGLGNGTALAFTGGAEANVSQNISVANLPNGLHFLYIRAKDTAGNWSLHSCKPVIKESAADATITRLEYFFDTDPGVGYGTAIPVTPANEVVYAGDLVLAGVSTGLHFFFLRAQNSLGYWSLLSTKMLLVSADAAPDLDRVEWYFTGSGADPGQKYTHPYSSPLVEVSEQFAISVSFLNQDGEYQLHFYSVNTLGQKSLEEIYPFTANFTPLNVSIAINGSQLTLSWDEIIGSAYYKVLVKNDPADPGILHTETDTDYSEPVTAKKFYELRAVSGP